MSNRSHDCSIEISQSNAFGDEADGRACVFCFVVSVFFMSESSSLRKGV